MTHYGFFSIAEMLAVASDLVEIKQSRSGSLLVLKIAQKPLVQTVSPGLPPLPSAPGEAPGDVGEGISRLISPALNVSGVFFFFGGVVFFSTQCDNRVGEYDVIRRPAVLYVITLLAFGRHSYAE